MSIKQIILAFAGMYLVFLVGIIVGAHLEKPEEPTGDVMPFVEYPETYHPTRDLAKTKIIWIRDPEQVKARLLEYEHDNPGQQARAVAVVNDERCWIYAYEPAHSNDKEAMWRLGHEFLHCFKGAYHDVPTVEGI